mmetsp:Transcript_26832/g.41951  ORF Transcript_26832/g.41951 Transcript_26832/m.41951 type:complete len:208 (+) Transcript_26832:918-1541(+)
MNLNSSLPHLWNSSHIKFRFCERSATTLFFKGQYFRGSLLIFRIAFLTTLEAFAVNKSETNVISPVSKLYLASLMIAGCNVSVFSAAVTSEFRSPFSTNCLAMIRSSTRPNTFLTSISSLTVISTMSPPIVVTLAGTIPCHPNQPRGSPGRGLEMIGTPRNSSGLKIIQTASLFVPQFRSPAITGMVKYRAALFRNSSPALSAIHLV